MSALFPQNKWDGPRFKDPWYRAEEWRYKHPLVASKFTWRQLLPGFGYASAAFAVYCVADYFLFADKHGHHGHSHNDGKSSHGEKH
ncbi:hypothetical protein MIR68_006375 [Amoeboaphelidium protococcarum]|nr:hypothetical protein MIR68_006375 [Amoeboaphelidium protococcarum]